MKQAVVLAKLHVSDAMETVHEALPSIRLEKAFAATPLVRQMMQAWQFLSKLKPLLKEAQDGPVSLRYHVENHLDPGTTMMTTLAIQATVRLRKYGPPSINVRKPEAALFVG